MFIHDYYHNKETEDFRVPRAKPILVSKSNLSGAVPGGSRGDRHAGSILIYLVRLLSCSAKKCDGTRTRPTFTMCFEGYLIILSTRMVDS